MEFSRPGSSKKSRSSKRRREKDNTLLICGIMIAVILSVIIIFAVACSSSSSSKNHNHKHHKHHKHPPSDHFGLKEASRKSKEIRERNETFKRKEEGKREVKVLTAGFCGYCNKLHSESATTRNLLEKEGYSLTFITDSENKEAFTQTAKENNVRGFPHVMIYENGQKISEFAGYLPSEKFVQKVLSAKPSNKETFKGKDKEVKVLTAGFCGYCKKLHSEADSTRKYLQKEGFKLTFVDDGENKEEFTQLSKANKVRGYPHSMIIVNGKKVAEFSGYMPSKSYAEKVKSLV